MDGPQADDNAGNNEAGSDGGPDKVQAQVGEYTDAEGDTEQVAAGESEADPQYVGPDSTIESDGDRENDGVGEGKTDK